MFHYLFPLLISIIFLLVFVFYFFYFYKKRLPKIELYLKNIKSLAQPTDGWVYVLSNKESFKDERIHKIGNTTISIEKRVKELQTSVPYDFKVEKIYFSHNAKKLETLVKSFFNNRKVNREFFRLNNISEVDRVIKYILSSYII